MDTPDDPATAVQAEALSKLLRSAPKPTAPPEEVRHYIHGIAGAGLHVLFVVPGSKTPADPRKSEQITEDDQAYRAEMTAAGRPGADRMKAPSGLHLATSDTDTLDRYLDRYREPADMGGFGEDSAVNLGVRMGVGGLIVVDADTTEEVDGFLESIGETRDTYPPTVTTPGAKDATTGEWKHKDGGHWYFLVPEGVELPPGTNMKLPGGGSLMIRDRYVLAPPSRRPEGDYTVTGPVRELPQALVAQLAAEVTKTRAEAEERRRRADERAERFANGGDTAAFHRSVTEWGAARSWSDILVPHGWAEAGFTDSCGCQVLTAPGVHASPRSATGHESGCAIRSSDDPPLTVWTDNPPAEFVGELSDDRYITRWNAVAILEHGGDRVAAARAEGFAGSPGVVTDEQIEARSRALEVASGSGAPHREVPQLPESFWERPVHQHIRRFAHSRMQAPLPLLGVVLARLGALLGPGVRVDTGVRSSLPLHVFLALCGASGTGKSAAISAGRQSFPDLGDVHPLAALGPISGTTGDLADAAELHDPAGVALVEFPPGSGEGLAEAFWGVVERETANGKVRTVRARVRDRALFTVDEGGSLVAQLSRDGSTTGPALRSAWAGEPIGQKNGRAETTRYVAAGEYALGLVMGIQTGPACELLTDREYGDGTPQRFLFVPATTNWLPEDSDRPDDPGLLRLTNVPSGEVRLCVELRTRVARDARDRTLGRVESPIEESHRPAYVARLAALLGILDRCSRGEGVGEITTEDWELAEQLFELSLTVQRNIRQEGARAAEVERAARARSRGRAQVEQEDAAAEKRVKRAMQAILRAARKPGDGRVSDIRHALRSDIRPEFDTALAILSEAGDVIVRGDDTIEVAT